ncbi:hypothetical protein B296_00013428 [Ensete ventricosum]|uniref:Uncharacterized protein n=1 Tax=Ensete ventricosum TaxID=4639 RepID=A0A427A1Q5_ENSVE|nr:hypothetical protein B296_00013428 [Ensete ventricosum]
MEEVVMLSTTEDQTAVDFDSDINLVEKEVIVLSTAWQGRKKGQRSSSQLEEVAAAVGGRYWNGKEHLARDHIQSRSNREVGRADGRRRSATGSILLARLMAKRRQAAVQLVEEEDCGCYGCLGCRGR